MQIEVTQRPGPISPTAATGSPIISAPTAGRQCITGSRASSTGWSRFPWAPSTIYFLKPRHSVWEERKHDWVEILGEVEHSH